MTHNVLCLKLKQTDKWLYKQPATISRSNSQTFLVPVWTIHLFVRYAVFALGSRAYPSFCAFGHRLDSTLADMGAHRIHPTGEGDELSGQEQSFISWTKETFVVSF